MAEVAPSYYQVEYATLLDYSPRGISPGSILSRRLVRDAVKKAQPNILDQVASTLNAEDYDEMERFLHLGVVLVPVPRSQPYCDSATWPSLEICRSVVRHGLAHSVWPGLRRTQGIRQSCVAKLGRRPEPEEHLETLAVIGAVKDANAFLIVDDFVTRGSTLVSSATALKAAYPKAEVKGFALVNTLSPGEEVKSIWNPRFGAISYDDRTLKRSSWAEKVASPQVRGIPSYEPRRR